ncbi:MAG TPA: SH3 domain-containing protein [Actinomycetota bacterium]
MDARRLLELDNGNSQAVGPPVAAPAASPAAAPVAAASPAAPARPMPQGRSLLALGGAAAAAVAAFLPWLSTGGLSVSAMDVAASILWSINPGDFFLKIGMLMLLLAGAAAAATTLPNLARYRKPAAIAIAVVTVGFVVQLSRALKGSGTGVFGAIGIGVYAALAGAVMIFAGDQPQAAVATIATRAAPAEPPPTVPGWNATHRVPAPGIRAWAVPDPSAPVATRLRGGMGLRIIEARGDWTHVEASNGWRGWVDGRRLEAGTS